ncbi:mechanosensitive ion channel family protein [Marinoscillum pacificum]|uniref:mechanosensitive ion channel family protein n=1 Tax=Marinoscillum pacificum TaxID=392723 RepID=UPI0021575916|nr:mechanosensitive ion channel family protein [Marinoscillum pacificum]
MEVIEWIEKTWRISETSQLKILYSLITFLILWTLRKLLVKLVNNKIENVREQYHWRNGVNNAYYIFLIIIIGSIWVDKMGSLATFFGLVTAGLAIALQDPIVNVAGWLFILIRKPFEVGDRIQIGDHAGDVIDIRFFQFTLNEINNWVDADQSTGRIIHVPNGQIFKLPQANYNQGFSHIWNEIGILITFESNWQKAKDILSAIVKKHTEHLTKEAQERLIEASKKYMIFYGTLTPIVYTAVKDSGVMLTMRYLVDPRKRRLTEHNIWEEVLERFAESNDIDFAYPTQRIYLNPQEGKPGTKPKNL